jgi:transglutaminase-like putative cysteine protease
MLLRIHHETKLTYTAPVNETVLEVRMAPPSDEDQTNLGYRLKITPNAPVTSYRDGVGNRVDLFNILTPYRELSIRATTIVRTHRRPASDRIAGLPWPDRGAAAIDALEFLSPSRLVNESPRLDEFVAGFRRPGTGLREGLEALMVAVCERLKYEKKVTTARTPLSEALDLGRGVCQDIAHLFLGAARALGLPARYVSGYVHGPGELATHAWCQAWGGPVGWIDVDPTRGIFAADDHVVIGVGRDFLDVPPNRGVWKGRADETITVAVNVEAIDRMPPDWGEWPIQAPWSPYAITQSQGQSQKRKANPAMQNGYRQQQSQQQQIRRSADDA